MGLPEQVAQRLGIALRTAGGMSLVSAADADRFLRGCEQARLIVLGIEGFRIEGLAVVPDMNAIADFAASRLPNVAESIAASLRFLGAVSRAGMWFDFTLQQEAS